eukprot:gene6018-6628_t
MAALLANRNAHESEVRDDHFPTALPSTLVGDFNIHHESGFSKPARLIPQLDRTVDSRSFQGRRIEDVRAIEHDPIREYYPDEKDFHKPSFLGLDNPETALEGVNFVADRHCLRKLLLICCPEIPNAFYSKRKDFSLVLRKHGDSEHVLTMQAASEDRWEAEPGSFGKGFELLMTSRRLSTVPADTKYYRLGKSVHNGFGVIVRYEVDAVDEGVTVELKSKTTPNPRYPVGIDFYRNIWIQMALSNTQRIVIGYHRKGSCTSMETLTLPQVQRRAEFSDDAASKVLKKLFNFLQKLYNKAHPSLSATGKATLRYHEVENKFSWKFEDTPEPAARPTSASTPRGETDDLNRRLAGLAI